MSVSKLLLGTSTGFTPVEIILAIVFFIGGFLILEFNKFIRLRNKVKQSKSTIDVYLNQRFDLIPNLVECVKAYAKYEEEAYAKIARIREEYRNDKDIEKGKTLSQVTNELLAVGENNPNLKANEQFLSLHKNLAKIENQLQAARRVYNGDVTFYNTTLETFPNNIFADLFKFEKATLFEVDDEKKENVIINLK